jgi:hypothetical protein
MFVWISPLVKLRADIFTMGQIILKAASSKVAKGEKV